MSKVTPLSSGIGLTKVSEKEEVLEFRPQLTTTFLIILFLFLLVSITAIVSANTTRVAIVLTCFFGITLCYSLFQRFYYKELHLKKEERTAIIYRRLGKERTEITRGHMKYLKMGRSIFPIYPKILLNEHGITLNTDAEGKLLGKLYPDLSERFSD